MKKVRIILAWFFLLGLLHLPAKEDFAKKAQKSMDLMEYNLAIENFGQAKINQRLRR